MKKLIDREKSIIIACDGPINDFESLVAQTADIPQIVGYKVGFGLGLSLGLPRTVEIIRKYTQKAIIYDHQKAANDIPATGKLFAQVCADAGIDSVILFPFTGRAAQEAWIAANLDAGLHVMVGGHMTHPQFLYSQGGAIHDDAPQRIYQIAIDAGIRDFVVPGNQPNLVSTYRQVIEQHIPEGEYCLYSPGFITQAGNIQDYNAVAGPNWQAIVGGAIYRADNIREAALAVCQQLPEEVTP